MPFEVLEMLTKETMPPMASLSYMRPQGRKSAQGGAYDRTKIKPRLLITLPTAIVIAKSPRFQVLFGTGADAGKLRVKGVKTGGVKPSEFKTHLILRCGYAPRLGDDIFDKETCAIRRLSEEEYEIDCPFLKEEGDK